MRLALSLRLPVEGLGRIRVRTPPAAFWPMGATLLLANQPLGSSATLVLLLGMVAGLCLTRTLPALPMANCALVAAAFLALHGGLALFVPANTGLAALYAVYGLACAAYFVIIRRTVAALSSEEMEESVALLLALDLLLNVLPVVLQIAVHGVGDFVGGLSGMLSSGSLSQGRTNTVRAGMLMVLAFTQFSRRRDLLSAASAGFNMMVLVAALSMTTILSAVGAGLTVILFGKNQSHRLLKAAFMIGMAVVGAIFNKLTYNVSSAAYLLALDFHYNSMPKLNMYKHLLEDILPYQPWSALVGNSLGNFGNRFAVLFNFENYSGFPGKAALADIFNSALTKEHMIERYNLEYGIVGNSILNVPWSSAMSVLLEAGLLGVLALFASLRRFMGEVLQERRGVLGSGLFLLAFFLYNLLFDVYLDYPEVLFPFFMIGALMAARARADREREAAASPAG